MAPSGCLVEIERVDHNEMENCRKKYPEAFEREYKASSGLSFDAWVIDEKL